MTGSGYVTIYFIWNNIFNKTLGFAYFARTLDSAVESRGALESRALKTKSLVRDSALRKFFS